MYEELASDVPIQPVAGQLGDCTENHNVGKKMSRLHEEVNDAYADGSRGIVETQLAKAGTRLAMIFNDIWP